MPDLRPLSELPPEAVESLLDRAFGAGRRARTAYRVRAGTSPIERMSFAAVEDETLIGSVQCWPVAVLADQGSATGLVMLGPVAVLPERQGTGIGGMLMRAALRAAGDLPMMLIGDAAYYGRFGFSSARTGRWRLPGPFERDRLLARGPAPDVAGEVVADTTVPA